MSLDTFEYQNIIVLRYTILFNEYLASYIELLNYLILIRSICDNAASISSIYIYTIFILYILTISLVITGIDSDWSLGTLGTDISV
jgi:hypothetical protein